MNPDYIAGVAAGERAAIRDQKIQFSRFRPALIRGDYHRGFWAGYTPRAETMKKTQPVMEEA